MNDQREEMTIALDPPASMAALLRGRSWARDTIGEEGSEVYRLRGGAGEADLYLKHGRGSVALDIADEMVRLRWLADHVPVPAVRHFVTSQDEAWLLMTAVPGRTAYQCLDGDRDTRPAIVDALARFMRRLHAIPVEDCPFNGDHRYRLGKAHGRMIAGLVDEEDFDEERAGRTARQVWDEMVGLLPLTPEPVVTHGDFSLDNLIFANGEVAGCIDVGRTGIADPYQDLAILWNCLGEFDVALQRRLLAAYGIGEPDMAKLRFHLMLDEFF